MSLLLFGFVLQEREHGRLPCTHNFQRQFSVMFLSTRSRFASHRAQRVAGQEKPQTKSPVQQSCLALPDRQPA